MVNQAFLQHLGIMVLGAAAAICIGRRLGLPTIVAYLIAGLLIGPVLGIIDRTTHATDLITETGIVLLLFLVGLELTFDKIREVGKVALIAGSAQVLLTALGGVAVSWLLGFRGSSVTIMGFALAFSSTVVVVKMLVSRSESHTVFGQIAVGVLLVQDVVVVLLLTVLGAIGAQAGTLDAMTLAHSVGIAIGGMMALLAVVLVTARFVLPRPMAWAARSPETLFMMSLCWCFIIVMATHVLHLSHEIGAFIAGVSLAQLPYAHDLQRRVQPLINFFVAIFFVTLGFAIRFQWDLAFWVQAMALSVFVLLGKFLLILIIVNRLRFSRKTAFYAALMLSQISEFSFILAGAASRAGLFETSAGSLLGVVGLITISLSSVAMARKEAFYLFFERHRLFDRLLGPSLEKVNAASSADDSTLHPAQSGHTIIVGMNTLGRELARRLVQRGETVIGIDNDPGKLEGLPCQTLLGDASMLPVLQEAHLADARLLVSTLHIPPLNDVLAYRCRVENVSCSIHAHDLGALSNLLEMKVEYIMVPKVDGLKRQSALLDELDILSPKK